MSEKHKLQISFFDKYLTVWVVLCMIVGVLIGRFLPGVPAFLGKFEYARVSIPIAVLIWVMMKVDFTRLCLKSRSGFERPFSRPAASGCIDDTTNIACFAVFARRKNCSLSGRRWTFQTEPSALWRVRQRGLTAILDCPPGTLV